MTRDGKIPTTPVDFDDIQGLVRFGHGALVDAEFLLCKLSDRDQACRWLRAAPITTAKTLEAPPKTALQIAMTASGMKALGLSDAALSGFSPPFLAGMAGEESRSRRLGDTGRNAPHQWGWDETHAHVLLMLYAREGGLAQWLDTVLDPSFKNGFNILQRFPTRTNDGTEPFGFRDGISEPKVDWKNEHPPSKHGREDYSNLISPGEVILGHRNEYNEVSAAPADDADIREVEEFNDLARNGSYLVFRQLAQDVAGFWKYMEHAAGGDFEAREALAAKLVGRELDGTPLVKGRRKIKGSRGGKDFTFEDDVNGVSCPLGAHIRRANPRTGDHPHKLEGRIGWLLSTLGFRRRRDKLPGRHDLVASTRFHRLIRRGRVYGSIISPRDTLKNDGKSEEAGLFFICLCADLVRQFEFVQNAWIASPTFNGLSHEADPLLGGRDAFCGVPSDGFSIQTADGVEERHSNLPQFVTVKGGGYFFLPSISALKIIAQLGTKER